MGKAGLWRSAVHNLLAAESSFYIYNEDILLMIGLFSSVPFVAWKAWTRINVATEILKNLFQCQNV